jgi:dihydrofolate reductase
MNLIVNVTPDWGIGRENGLLVSIPADLRRFRELTTGKVVILGRKTLATFPGGRPLKNRVNLVLSSNPDFTAEGAEVVHSERELLEKLRTYPREQLCVIGGASVYEMLLDYCDTAQLTKTYVNLPADRRLPDLDALPNWEIRKISDLQTDNGLQFQYIDYVNLSPRRF